MFSSVKIGGKRETRYHKMFQSAVYDQHCNRHPLNQDIVGRMLKIKA